MIEKILIYILKRWYGYDVDDLIRYDDPGEAITPKEFNKHIQELPRDREGEGVELAYHVQAHPQWDGGTSFRIEVTVPKGPGRIRNQDIVRLFDDFQEHVDGWLANRISEARKPTHKKYIWKPSK